jgi:hypothetical protein
MQVNYYAKYLKYKQKYLDLKKEMVVSGGGGTFSKSKPPPRPTAAKPPHWWEDGIAPRGIRVEKDGVYTWAKPGSPEAIAAQPKWKKCQAEKTDWSIAKNSAACKNFNVDGVGK